MTEERELYRLKCKHLGTEDICLRDSGFCGGLWYKNHKTGESGYSGMHMTLACDGNCQRMKRYDKLHKEDEK